MVSSSRGDIKCLGMCYKEQEALVSGGHRARHSKRPFPVRTSGSATTVAAPPLAPGRSREPTPRSLGQKLRSPAGITLSLLTDQLLSGSLGQGLGEKPRLGVAGEVS